MTDESTCEICSARSAEAVVIRRRGDDLHRVLACRECAGEHARLLADPDLDLGEVFARLDSRRSPWRPDAGCELCGETVAQAVAQGKPGCCRCYGRFAAELEESIREAQGHTRHVGKAPSR